MKQIQRHRERQGLLQSELASKANVCERTIKNLEDGADNKVQARVRKGLCKALGLKPVDIFNSEGKAR